MIIRKTNEVALPFDIADGLTHVRADLTETNAVLGLMHAAAGDLEEHGDLAFGTRDLTVILPDGWPDPDSKTFNLPKSPAQLGGFSMTSGGNDVTSLGTLEAGMWPRVVLSDAPSLDLLSDELVITYQAGFGAGVSDIPADLRQAVFDQTAALYDRRGAGNRRETWLSPHAARIIARYRRVQAA